MINELAMALMFAALFILLLSAVIVGSRVKKTNTDLAPETVEEPPKEPPKMQELLAEERPPAGAGQFPVSADVFEEEEPYLIMPEPEFFMPEQPVEVPEPEPEALGMETVFFEPDVVFTEPVIEESVPEIDEDKPEAHEPEVVSPEPVLLETVHTEEPAMDELTFEDTYREPNYFRDEDVIPIQGVTTCPHCGEKVPSTLYCINCGKSLNE
jgi:hypothetical protein